MTTSTTRTEIEANGKGNTIDEEILGELVRSSGVKDGKKMKELG